MSFDRPIELAIGVAILVASVWLYRANRKADHGYGSQGGVLLLVVGAIVMIHALGLLHYRPSQSEIEAAQARGR